MMQKDFEIEGEYFLATAPKIPRSFLDKHYVKYILVSVVGGFDYEEQQVIYFFHVLGICIDDIAKASHLPPRHILNVLNLYTDRLNIELGFFKSYIDYDDKDLLTVGEMLLLGQSD